MKSAKLQIPALNLVDNPFYVARKKKMNARHAYPRRLLYLSEDEIGSAFILELPTNGVGLSLVYDIVRTHGGEFNVETTGKVKRASFSFFTRYLSTF